LSPYVRPYAVGRGDRLAALSVLAILFAVYTATMTGLPDNPDAEVEFQTTSALAREHTLALSGTSEAEAIAARQFNVVRGPDGESYAWFGPGQALVALPFYAVGRALAFVWPAIEARHAATTRLGVARSEYFAHLLVGWRNPLLSALCGFLIVLTARRLGMGRPAAWVSGLTYGLSTFAWAQARSTLSDVQATLFLFLAFHGVVVVAERFQRLRQPRAHELAVVGLALGLCVLTRVAALPAALVVLAAGLSSVWRGNRRIRRTYEPAARPDKRTLFALLAFLLVPFGACLAAFAWLNQLRFGDPLETGYGAVLAVGTFFSYPPLEGLLGLVLSPGKGLLFMAPALLLVPFGLTQVTGRDLRLWTRTALGVALAVGGPIAFTQTWHGAWTYGPRYLLPLLPFAWLGVGFALEKPRPWLRRAAAGLFALGFLVALPASLVDHVTHQELALHAARVQWPEPGGADEREADDARFLLIQWDPGFAAPWAHWRIFRHRVAGQGEVFPLDDIFRLDVDLSAMPAEERERGFQHLAWVDLATRLSGSPWPAVLGSVVLFCVGAVLALLALDRARL
jgi:hypothetical protein